MKIKNGVSRPTLEDRAVKITPSLRKLAKESTLIIPESTLFFGSGPPVKVPLISSLPIVEIATVKPQFLIGTALTAATSALKARCLETEDFRKVAYFYADLAGNCLHNALVAGEILTPEVDDHKNHIICSNLLAWLCYSGFGTEEGDALSYYFRLALFQVELLDTSCNGTKIPTKSSLPISPATAQTRGSLAMEKSHRA